MAEQYMTESWLELGRMKHNGKAIHAGDRQAFAASEVPMLMAEIMARAVEKLQEDYAVQGPAGVEARLFPRRLRRPIPTTPSNTTPETAPPPYSTPARPLHPLVLRTLSPTRRVETALLLGKHVLSSPSPLPAAPAWPA